MGVVGGPDPIVTDGLVLAVDPANTKSYPGSGTNVTDLITEDTYTINGASFSSNNSGFFDFDGSNDYISIQSNSLIQPASGLSVQAWFNADAIGNAFPGIVSAGQNGSLVGGYILSLRDSDDKITMYIRDGSSWVAAASNLTISFGQWYHAIGTWDGSTVKLYINGVLQTTTASASSIAYNTGLDNTIGRYGTNTYTFNGKVSKVLIYNRALNAAEVLKNYNALKDRFV